MIKSEKQRTIELPKIVYERVIGQNNVVTWKKVNTEEPIDFNGNKKAWNEYQPPVFLKDDKTEELLHSDNIVQDIDVGGREQRSGKLGKLIEHTRRESNSLDKKLIPVKNNLVNEQGDLKGGYKSYLEHEKLHLPNAVPPEGSLEKKIRDHQNSIPQLNTLKQNAETKLAMLTRIEAELDSGRAGTTGPSEALDDFRFRSNINITDNRQYNDPLIKEKIKKAIAASRRENTINKQEADKEIATKNKLISEQKKELFEAGRPYKMALVSLDETQASLTAMRNQYKKLLDDHVDANNLFKLSVDDLAAVKAEYNNLTDKISAVIKFRADLKIKPLQKQIESVDLQLQTKQNQLQTLVQNQITPLQNQLDPLRQFVQAQQQPQQQQPQVSLWAQLNALLESQTAQPLKGQLEALRLELTTQPVQSKEDQKIIDQDRQQTLLSQVQAHITLLNQQLQPIQQNKQLLDQEIVGIQLQKTTLSNEEQLLSNQLQLDLIPYQRLQ